MVVLEIRICFINYIFCPKNRQNRQISPDFCYSRDRDDASTLLLLLLLGAPLLWDAPRSLLSALLPTEEDPRLGGEELLLGAVDGRLGPSLLLVLLGSRAMDALTEALPQVSQETHVEQGGSCAMLSTTTTSSPSNTDRLEELLRRRLEPLRLRRRREVLRREVLCREALPFEGMREEVLSLEGLWRVVLFMEELRRVVLWLLRRDGKRSSWEQQGLSFTRTERNAVS